MTKLAVYCLLTPGELSLQHVQTVHASKPNFSANRRIGVAVRDIMPYVRQINSDIDSVSLVRGDDRFGNSVAETLSQADMYLDLLGDRDRIYIVLRRSFPGRCSRPG